MKKKNSYSDHVRKMTKQLLGESSMSIVEEESAYEKFFSSALEKFGVESPGDLPDDKKDDFFNYVDANWDAGDNETDPDSEEPGDEPLPEGCDEDPVDEAAPDSPGQEDLEQNADDEPDPESALREMIRSEIAAVMAEAYLKRG